VCDDLGLGDLNDKINQTRRDLEDAKNRRGKILQQRILDMTVSFPIDKYFISDIQKRNVEAVANYIKSHPDMNVVICGYADVETAYPAYNMRLSKRRVTSVFNMLVNEYGVNPNRLRIDYKGDTLQPYDRKNEWNRVVVFVLEPVEEKTTIN
jgi:outer membrane protein OmpA-like peptidoglycan-associated protein